MILEPLIRDDTTVPAGVGFVTKDLPYEHPFQHDLRVRSALAFVSV